jgi:hypothetical protein
MDQEILRGSAQHPEATDGPFPVAFVQSRWMLLNLVALISIPGRVETG